MYMKRLKKGFTLIELLIVIAVIAILSTVLISVIQGARSDAYTARAITEFKSFAQAMEFYLIDYDEYPPDVSRNIPSGMEEYLGGGTWPEGPHPGSVYDWDNITEHGYIQISLRFCDINGENCNFPDEPWAQDFDDKSAMYWCFEGPCRSHPDRPVDHPGYCVSCKGQN